MLRVKLDTGGAYDFAKLGEFWSSHRPWRGSTVGPAWTHRDDVHDESSGWKRSSWIGILAFLTRGQQRVAWRFRTMAGGPPRRKQEASADHKGECHESGWRSGRCCLGGWDGNGLVCHHVILVMHGRDKCFKQDIARSSSLEGAPSKGRVVDAAGSRRRRGVASWQLGSDGGRRGLVPPPLGAGGGATSVNQNVLAMIGRKRAPVA